jgi:rod shape-determining protein MreC
MANGTWKIARGKGSAQLPLAIVALLAVVLVLLGKAHSSVFDRVHTFYSDSIAPALEQVSAPFDGVGKWVSGFGGIFTVYSDNLRLREQNARLRQWQNAAIVLRSRLRRYQLLLNAVPDPALDSITARVIGRENRPFVNTIILDAGKTRGVKPGEAVVDARGLLGRIYLAGHHTSWVILATDLNSRIPVTIEPGDIHAIMAGDNSRAPILEAESQDAHIKAGDQIVTSGDGGLLPSGLPVGAAVWNGQNFRAALLADPATSDDVRILALKAAPEQPPAPNANDLPSVAAGLPPMAPAPAVAQPPPVAVQAPAAGLKSPALQKPAAPQTQAGPSGNAGDEDR